MPALLLTNIGQLLTLRGPAPRRGHELADLSIVEDAAVLCADGKIVAVGRRGEITKQAEKDAQEVDCERGVVLPGFVDSHTHPVFAAPRLVVCEEMIPRAAGTAVETRHIASQRSDSTWHAASQKTGRTKRTTIRVPVKQKTGQAPSLRRTSRLAEFVDVFLERGAFTSDEAERIFASAKQHGLGIRAHVCQLSATTDQWLARMAKRFDIASFDHLDCIREGDIAALAKLNTMCTLLPGANYFLGLKEYPPARKLID